MAVQITNPINSPAGANGYYGIQNSSNLLNMNKNPTSSAGGLTKLGYGLNVLSGMMSGYSSFQLAQGLSSSIDEVINQGNLKLSQINSALNQGQAISSRQANITIQKHQLELSNSEIGLGSEVAMKQFNQDYANKLSQDFISDVNGTVEKLNTLFTVRNQVSSIVQQQEQGVLSGAMSFIGAGISAGLLVATL
jgi:hypothetical protein